MKDNGETKRQWTSRLTTPHNGQNVSLSCAPTTIPRARHGESLGHCLPTFTPVTTISYTRSVYDRITVKHPRAATIHRGKLNDGCSICCSMYEARENVGG